MLEKLVLNSSMYLSTQDVDDAMLQFDSMPRNEYEKEIKRKRKRKKTSCATHVSFVVIVDFVSYTRELMWVCDVKRTCNQRSIDSHSENSLRNSIPFSLFIRFLSSLFWTHLTRVVHTHKILYHSTLLSWKYDICSTSLASPYGRNKPLEMDMHMEWRHINIWFYCIPYTCNGGNNDCQLIYSTKWKSGQFMRISIFDSIISIHADSCCSTHLSSGFL